MQKITLTIEINCDKSLTLADNVKKLAQKVRGEDLLDLPIKGLKGTNYHSFTMNEALSQSRAAAYEQYFSGQVGPELQAIGKLKPTQEAVIKQIQEYYSV